MATEYQITVLENKLASIKPDPVKGTYPSSYYALKNKIAALKLQMRKQIRRSDWDNFLAQ